MIPRSARPWTAGTYLSACVLTLLTSCGEAPGPATGHEAPAQGAAQAPAAAPRTRLTKFNPFEEPDQEEPERVSAGADWPELSFRRADRGLPTAGTWREEPLLHDFTGDGRASLVASNREEDGLNVWEFLGDGSWKLRISGLRRDLMYGGSAAADFNGDGRVDLLFGSHKLGLILYLNDGSMGWTQGPEIASQVLMIDVDTGDLNGDGIPDAAGIGQFNGGIQVFLGDGQGGLRLLPESSSLGWIGFGMTIALEDLDGDGLDDLLCASKVGARAFLTRVAEDGSLSWLDASKGLPVPREGNTMRSVVAADVLGDGRLEVITGRIGPPTPDANHFGVYRWDSDQELWIQIDSGVPRDLSYSEALAADFDRDGHIDLLLAASGLVAIYRGDGTGKFTLAGKLPGVVGSRHRAALGDVDGDGWIDLVLLSGGSKHERRSGALTVYLNGPDVWENLGAREGSAR
jgi:hypothetical protein